MSAHPNLLYFCDFPPSNLRGGSVLLSRLLENYPTENITILTGTYYNGISPSEGRLNCKQFLFPTSDETGRWGVGRLKSLIQWLVLPFLVIYGLWIEKRRNIKLILAVAHGHFFIAAALTSLFTGLPLILFVHDDWVSWVRSSSIVLKVLAKPLFRFAAGRASHIYTVTPHMQEMLEREYRVKSEVQFPAIEIKNSNNVAVDLEEKRECLKLFYAGSGTGATEDSFNMFIQLVKSSTLEKYGIKDWELNLFVLATSEDLKRCGWEHERIKFRGWVSQQQLREELLKADILFLPFSFKEEQRFATEQAFPSKTADYLASGKPILIFAPPYSSIVKYGRKHGFAEIVDEASEERLAEGIVNIWESRDHRLSLTANSRVTLISNHNIQKQRDDLIKVIQKLTDEKRKAALSTPVRRVSGHS